MLLFIYAVYAISSFDTGSSLRHRTQNMQLRRDTPGSCRAHSPAVLGSLFNAVYAVYAVYTVYAVYAVQKTTVSASAKTAREAGRGQ